jgi:hypothetical protein
MACRLYRNGADIFTKPSRFCFPETTLLRIASSFQAARCSLSTNVSCCQDLTSINSPIRESITT